MKKIKVYIPEVEPSKIIEAVLIGTYESEKRSESGSYYSKEYVLAVGTTVYRCTEVRVDSTHFNLMLAVGISNEDASRIWEPEDKERKIPMLELLKYPINLSDEI